MKLAIITIVKHTNHNNAYYGYAPYVREMNLWGNHVDELLVVGPKNNTNTVDAIDTNYDHDQLQYIRVPNFNILTFWQAIRAVFVVPIIFFKCCYAMSKADHIHLRCPGNISLIACFAQVFFPNKKKSAKYAGNWDPQSNQPWSYRLQQAILRNTFLSRNMQVLVYGEWPNETSNIHPFISATYREAEKVPFINRNYSKPLEFVFAGALVVGKRPLLTIQIIEALNNHDIPVKLHMFGDGPLMHELQAYIKDHQLESKIKLYGNRDKSEVKAALMDAHFNILPSKSEGWPKAVAEGMFFGCIPVATSVSCVSWMLGEGTRGIIIEPDLEEAVSKILDTLKHEDLHTMAKAALDWSQQYTFDRLEADIKAVLDGTF
ncbi:MAG: glycosyl transferase [Bacteroidetes bacterium]|nr:MAG: glycosyl transferase [Bacteroidota bacterium]